MNNYLDAAGITHYERAILTALATATTGAELVTALQTFDVTLQADRLRQSLTNVQKSCALNTARATIVNDALAAL